MRKEVERPLAADQLRDELEAERQRVRDMATRIDRLHQEQHPETRNTGRR